MEELKTVHYVTQDPIHNIKIKITLTRLSAARPRVKRPTRVTVGPWTRHLTGRRASGCTGSGDAGIDLHAGRL